MAENVGDGSTGQNPHGGVQPSASFAFDAAEPRRHRRGDCAKYPPNRKASAVIAALYEVQKQMGRQTGSAWVPRVAMDVVAERLEMAPIRVYEVATFYLMFNTEPIGRYHLQVCTTTPCWLRGSDAVEAACRKVTGIKGWHETSADGMFTMSEVECLGACVNAPVLQVDDDYYEDLDGPAVERAAGGAGPRRAAQARQRHRAPDLRPEGGPNTLLTVTE